MGGAFWFGWHVRDAKSNNESAEIKKERDTLKNRLAEMEKLIEDGKIDCSLIVNEMESYKEVLSLTTGKLNSLRTNRSESNKIKSQIMSLEVDSVLSIQNIGVLQKLKSKANCNE